MTSAAATVDVLAAQLGGDPSRFAPVDTGDGMPTIYVPREELPAAARVLREAPELQFAFLADIVAVDYFPREPRFEVVYLLVFLGESGLGREPRRLRVRVRVPGDDPRLPTVSDIWLAANWAEREVYDLFGIEVDGHPDLRRILMPDDWEGFPLRKDYPVQIRDPVKTYAPLQVTEEEFVANIENARSRTGPD